MKIKVGGAMRRVCSVCGEGFLGTGKDELCPQHRAAAQPQRSDPLAWQEERLEQLKQEERTSGAASSEAQEWTITKDSHFAYLKSSAHGSFMFPVSEFDQLQQVTSCINAALAAEREKRKPLVEVLKLLLDAVDYMAGNCTVNSMVGAVLDAIVIEKARAALAQVKGGEVTYEGHQIKCRKVKCGSRGEYWIDTSVRCNCQRAKRRRKLAR